MSNTYPALFFAPVAYATGGYGLLYLFGLPDSSVTGLVCATLLGSILGLLLCMEELLQTSRVQDGSLTRGARPAGPTAVAARPARAGGDATQAVTDDGFYAGRATAG
jgi:hypothetical protein